MSDTTYYPFDPPESYRDYIMKMMEADLRKATSVFNVSTSGPVQMPTIPRRDAQYRIEGRWEAPEFEGAKITYATYGTRLMFTHGEPITDPAKMVIDHADILKHKPSGEDDGQ